MDNREIIQRIRGATARDRGTPKAGSAGVAIILDTLSDDPSLLLIRRAVHPDDPWSGHIALPGGRWHDDDPDLVHTAAREVEEEVGIDLGTSGEWIGTLDPVTPVGGARHTVTVLPSVFRLRRPVDIIPNAEVAAVRWAPIRSLQDRSTRGTHRYVAPNGLYMHLPTFELDDFMVWGLTHRILTGFMDRL